MKIEFDSDDIAVIAGAICVALLILSLKSCERVVETQVRERLKEVQHDR